VYKGVTTSELDELAAETAASLTATHPDYAVLAARIAISNLHKNTLKSFSRTVKLLRDHVNPKTGAPSLRPLSAPRARHPPRTAPVRDPGQSARGSSQHASLKSAHLRAHGLRSGVPARACCAVLR